jgi:hypothetical protein
MLFFPSAMVRVNKALPEQVYTSGSHVILSESVSEAPYPEATWLLI